MNSKIILAASAAIIALALPFNPAHAGPSHRHSDTFTDQSGLYVGGFGGYSWTDADVGASDADINGADLGVFIGYTLDAFLDRTIGMGINGAIEAHYAWSNADDSNGAGNTETDDEWGVSFRPGLSFFNYEPLGIKPYAILGYRNAEFDSTVAGVNQENLDGFELGIGTELVAYGNYGVRLDYSHVFYGEENGIDADENDIRLGVAYHF
jgi:hypothetical protein